jgi:hypothetical protein
MRQNKFGRQIVLYLGKNIMSDSPADIPLQGIKQMDILILFRKKNIRWYSHAQIIFGLLQI